jgi:hypothetical protein
MGQNKSFMNSPYQPEKDLLRIAQPEAEPQSKTVIAQPISLDLYDAKAGAESNLPVEVKTNPKLLEEAEDRRILVSLLKTVFTLESKNQSHLFELDFELLYLELIDFLKKDHNHARLLLYLPFSIWPDIHHPLIISSEIASTITDTVQAFKEAWLNILLENDPRPNFVDGDIGEVGMAEAVRVHKAGHLVPELLKRGIIDYLDLEVTLTTLNHPDSMQSIMEGVMVATDLDLLTTAQRDVLIDVVRRQGLTFWFTEPTFLAKQSTNELKPEPESGLGQNVSAQLAKLQTELTAIDNQVSQTLVSPERVRWLKSVQKEQLIKKTAEQLTKQLLDDMLSTTDVRRITLSSETEPVLVSTLVQALTLTGEKLAQSESPRLSTFIPDALSLLTQLANTAELDFHIKDALEGGLNRWLHAGIITQGQFAQTKLTEHNLAEPLPVNLQQQLETDWQFAQTAAEKIKQHPVLNQALFPVVLLFGSRLKGYATTKADSDGAIFFKPAASWEERESVLKLLKEVVPELSQIDKLLEYWTKETNGTTSMRVIDTEEDAVIGPEQIHFMFGGAWVGDPAAISQIQHGILPRYLDLSRFGEEQEEVRSQLLRRMELDVVQYRLMHKGYSRYYQTAEPLNTPHAQLIDANSVFWDEGYRRAASQLFLSRVFLPDLSE